MSNAQRSMQILVTGPTGNVGRHVVEALQKRGVPVVAAVRDATSDDGLSCETREFDFLNRDTWKPALNGVNRIFLMRPPPISDVENTLNPFVDFAREHDVDHIVFLSVAGAGENRVVPHRKVEDHLRAMGDGHFTNLRPGFFAQNLESAYRQDIVEDDRIFVPAGKGQPVNWIDARDIGEVAALVLARPEAHRGNDYTLAGPGAVSWQAVVDTLSRVLGRTIEYEPASVPGYMLHLSRRGLPRGAILVQTVLHFLLRFGQGSITDTTVERLLDRPARTIHEYIEEHAEVWAKSP